MSRKHRTALLGQDLFRRENGVLVVSHKCPELRAEYAEQVIPDYLAHVDHSAKLSKKEYETALRKEEEEFNRLVRERLAPAKRSVIVVLQGRDGAGKTGARVRIEAALDNDAKLFQAICIGPPSEDERSHPYLWRFSTGERMPQFGQVRVFDRSWAERLLVEPVMKITPLEDVQKSYAEIRTFEWLLQQQGAIVVKLWMDITKPEQKRRFEKRKAEKPWKLSDSDAIARKNWNKYTRWANEMFHRTGTDFAPWHIVSSEDKRYSRITVLQIINRAIREACPEK